MQIKDIPANLARKSEGEECHPEFEVYFEAMHNDPHFLNLQIGYIPEEEKLEDQLHDNVI